VVLQVGLVAAERDSMEVEMEARGGSPKGTMAITAAISRSVIARSVFEE
jgi:hypothetical protein